MDRQKRFEKDVAESLRSNGATVKGKVAIFDRNIVTREQAEEIVRKSGARVVESGGKNKAAIVFDVPTLSEMNE